MKLFLTLSLGFLSLNAHAYQYTCEGIDRASRNQDEAILDFTVDGKSVLLEDMEGTEHSIDLDSTTERLSIYADYGYDGYGGYIEFRIPRFVAESEYPVEDSFTVYYTEEIYSELGNVGSIDIKATCKASN